MGMLTTLAVSALSAYAGSHLGGIPQRGMQAYGPQGAIMAEAPTGRATVIDGDTIEIHRIRVRLFGIDAPESSQSCQDSSGAPYPCGRMSAMALDRMIQGRVVSCQPRDQDKYGRLVAVCSAGGLDLNGWMVRNGQAIAFTRYGADYAGAESEARRQRVGIWQGAFEEPARYRAAQKGGRYGSAY